MSADFTNIFHKKIMLTISKKTCFIRRNSTTCVPTDYFEKILWPAFREHNNSVLEMNDVLILNGEDSPETILTNTTKYLIGESVPSSPEIHRRNLQDDENLEDLYELYNKNGRLFKT